MQALARGARGLFAQEQLEVGIVAAQAGQDVGEHEGRDRRDHAHPHLARQRPAGSARDVPQFLRLAQHAARLVRDPVAQRREAHDAAGAFDEGDADQRFEFAQTRRQRGLGDEARLGRAAEMAMVLQRDEILQLFERGEVGRRHGLAR